MSRKVRVGIEAALAFVCVVLTIASLFWPTWFESLSGESPDGGDGSFERLLAIVWIAGTVLFATMARRDFKRLQALRA